MRENAVGQRWRRKSVSLLLSSDGSPRLDCQQLGWLNCTFDTAAVRRKENVALKTELCRLSE